MLYHYIIIDDIASWCFHLRKKTTIMITIETKKLLDKAKRIFGGKTYDDIIRIVLNKVLSIPESRKIAKGF